MKPAPTITFDSSERAASYEDLHSKATLAGRFLEFSHKLLEDTVPSICPHRRVVEVGAGSGNHFKYVDRTGLDAYVLTDASDAMLQVARRKYSDELSQGLLTCQLEDAARLSFRDDSFERLIATHVLEHIADPVRVLREWHRVVVNGGIISLVLPCDPGMMWRFGRKLGPRRNALKLGIEYDYQMAAEHVNSIFNLAVFIRYHFRVLSERWYPLRVPAPDLNLFYICHLAVEK